MRQNIKERKNKMKGKKVITYAVSFLVALGCVSAFPVTVKADTGYEVYPNPHSMTYVFCRADGAFSSAVR